jgi:hypothetical protein
MQPAARQLQQLDYDMKMGSFVCGPCRGVILKTIGATRIESELSVVSCQLIGSSTRKAVKREPEGGKLKNLHC